MNRPKIYDDGYLTKARIYMKNYEYIKCINNDYLELAKYCEHLEKALDKACAKLNELAYQNLAISVDIEFDESKKKIWKEWCLKVD